LGIGRFFLNVPVDKPRDERFRLQFCLRSWTWKLCGIELPGPLLVGMAQEVVKRERSGLTIAALMADSGARRLRACGGGSESNPGVGWHWVWADPGDRSSV
jgi:hypothetical protein